MSIYYTELHVDSDLNYVVPPFFTVSVACFGLVTFYLRYVLPLVSGGGEIRFICSFVILKLGFLGEKGAESKDDSLSTFGFMTVNSIFV